MIARIRGFLRPFLAEPVKHVRRWQREPAYRTYHSLAAQLRGIPRRKPISVEFDDLYISAPDAASLLSTYREIFLHQIYAFRFDGDRPRILDLGANIGLSVLFFKQQYPNAAITAVEADAEIFSYLEQNVQSNGLQDVALVNKVAWNADTTLLFRPDQADGGRVSLEQIPAGQLVDAIDVAVLFRDSGYDFVKMDIEGAESTVLPACLPYLQSVTYLFVEYHSFAGQPQELACILEMMAGAGYRLSVDRVWGNRSPLTHTITNELDMDLQVNIFGWRE